MSNFKNLEMAAAVSAHKNITVKKSLFSTKVIYTPTQSTVKDIILEYAPADGERVKRLLDMPLDKMVSEIEQKAKPATTPVGHYRLEVCLSDDQQFCAIQLFSFIDLKYNAATEFYAYEGSDAQAVVKLIS